MVRSNLEYASLIWNPYLQQDIERIEKVQRKAARFISGNYITRDEGFMTTLLQELDLPTLQDRRKENRLRFLFQIVNGSIPSINPEDFLTPRPPKRRIKPTSEKHFVTCNIIENQANNNSKSFKYVHSKSDQYKNSFFPATIIQWNHLSDSSVQCKSLASFKARLHPTI